MKAVIMAGGRGTRIAALAGDLPKPMLPIDGRPVLERELGSLREQGVTDVLITVGHLAPAIMEYFGDGSGCSPQTGRPFGVHIEYFVEKEPLGNAGALFRIRDRLDEDFLLLNGDVMFDVDLQRFAAFHKVHGGLATLFTHPNGHPYDSGLIVADSEQRVTQWLTKEDARPQYYRNRVNAGLHILSPKLLEGDIPAGKVDLDRQILKPLAGTGQLLCYDSPEYVKDMGTPERYAAVCEDVRSGHAAARNLRRKQKAVFLDRDGTINRYVGFLRNIDEFELLPGVAQAVRKINELGWLAIVVTNQPVIARGEVTEEQLEAIHCKMETLLGREGAWLDAIYYCPHHPDKGFPGERPELKIHCSCRKPAPGMLLDAAQRFNIDLSRSWMVGDGKNDVLAGKMRGAGRRCSVPTGHRRSWGRRGRHHPYTTSWSRCCVERRRRETMKQTDGAKSSSSFCCSAIPSSPGSGMRSTVPTRSSRPATRRAASSSLRATAVRQRMRSISWAS